MRRLAWLLPLLWGCAAPPGGAEASPTAPRLLRSEGVARYRISVVTDEGRGPRRAVATATIRTRADGTDLVELEEARVGPLDGEAEPIELDETVRAAFGGDERVLGRFVVGPDFDPGAVLPEGAPEPLLGLVLDLASVLIVQSAGFGADRLREPGDAEAFDAFDARWRVAPALLDARLRCEGGTLRLVSLDVDEAVLSWEPLPMAVTIVRRSSPDSRLLLDGSEDFVLEVRCDPRTGHLRSGRSLRDVLDLSLHMGWSRDETPGPGEERPAGGMRIKIERSIELVEL
jgi:hypothetical protein